MPPVPYLPTTYLEHNAIIAPDTPALLQPGVEVSFAELLDLVSAAARNLAANGLSEGEVVAVQLANRWEYPVLELAIPRLGAVVMPLPLTLGAHELRQCLSRAGAALLVTGEGEEHDAAWAVAGELRVPVTPVGRLLGARGEGPPLPVLAPDPDRIVEIALTSGTTGLPKLASLSARLKQATYEGFTRRLEMGAGDRVMPMSPLMQGIGGMCLYALRNGAALVLSGQPRFSAEATLQVAAALGATHLVGVPTQILRMLECPALDAVDLSAARVTAVAGAPMPPDGAAAWEHRTGSKVCIFYGSMDTGQLSVGSPSDPPEKRWTTVGRPHECNQVLILDEAGNRLGAGEIGSIHMRGPTVQARYWGEAAGPAGPDGWAPLGDLGLVDPEGYVQVLGRARDIIIRGGTNINPYEVENLLRRHPQVADACVVGSPDPQLGERVMAFVVPRGKLDLRSLRGHLAELGLARYKWPEHLELIEEIPVAGPGKVDRGKLKARAEQISATARGG